MIYGVNVIKYMLAFLLIKKTGQLSKEVG